MTNIHPTAIVSEGAKIGDNCVIGAYCIVGKQVILENNVTLMSHVVVDGDTVIGEGTKVFPFVVIGTISQDLKYKGQPTKIRIGKNNTIREHVTVHLATEEGGGVTVIENNCLIMVAAHVAHDVYIGNDCIIGNNVLLAGHVNISEGVIVSGGVAVHQHCRIGEHAFIGGMSGVGEDIVPYALFTGVRETGEINGINIIGLKRKGFSTEDIHGMRHCYDLIFSKDKTFQDNIMEAQALYQGNDKILKVIDFIMQGNSRSICSKYRKR